MESCSLQCIRQALYAVIVGISPIIICLFLIGLVRILIHCLEMAYHRQRKTTQRRRSSALFYQSGRSTLLYTPVSIAELRRIIQGEYRSQQPTESLSTIPTNDNNNTPKGPTFIKSLLSRRDSPPQTSSNTIANLIVRHNALNTIPFTALLASVSTPTTPKFDIINEQKTRRPSFMTIKNDKTTLATIGNHNNDRFNRNGSDESEQVESDALLITPMTTAASSTNSIFPEEPPDFYSARSIPYALN